jgi:ribosomal protein S20
LKADEHGICSADAQRAHNTTLRSALRTAIKKVRKAIAAALARPIPAPRK